VSDAVLVAQQTGRQQDLRSRPKENEGLRLAQARGEGIEVTRIGVGELEDSPSRTRVGCRWLCDSADKRLPALEKQAPQPWVACSVNGTKLKFFGLEIVSRQHSEE
jgi:hypothetical protein